MVFLSLAAKAALIWCLIAVLAIGNGVFRERLLLPSCGKRWALSISGVMLSLLVLAAAWLFAGFLDARQPGLGLLLGFQWLVMTLAFEFIFGKLVTGKSWRELRRIFDPRSGDLFVLVLLVTLLAPWLAGKMRGYY